MSFDAEETRLLNKTVSLRERILNEMTEKHIPEDKDDRKFFLGIIDGLDRTILGKKRIKVEEDLGKSSQALQNAVAEVMLNAARNRSSGKIRATTPALPPEVTLGEMVEGETAIDPVRETYDDFINRRNAN